MNLSEWWRERQQPWVQRTREKYDDWAGPMEALGHALLMLQPISWHAADHEGHAHDRGVCGGRVIDPGVRNPSGAAGLLQSMGPVTLGTTWWNEWGGWPVLDQGSEGSSVGYGVVSPLMLHGASPRAFSADDIKRIYTEASLMDDGNVPWAVVGDHVLVNGVSYAVTDRKNGGKTLVLKREP